MNVREYYVLEFNQFVKTEQIESIAYSNYEDVKKAYDEIDEANRGTYKRILKIKEIRIERWGS